MTRFGTCAVDKLRPIRFLFGADRASVPGSSVVVLQIPLRPERKHKKPVRTLQVPAGIFASVLTRQQRGVKRSESFIHEGGCYTWS